MRSKENRTFFAIIVPVGTCSTFFTLPPFPWPSSCRSLRSSFFKSNLISAFISRLARVVDKAAWYVFLRITGKAECGAVAPPNTVNTVPSCSTAETGGGRFLPTGAGTWIAPGSCKALKFLFFRIGLVGDAIYLETTQIGLGERKGRWWECNNTKVGLLHDPGTSRACDMHVTRTASSSQDPRKSPRRSFQSPHIKSRLWAWG